MRTSHDDRCVFGLASMQNVETAREPLSDLMTWLGERADVELSTRFLPSYESLATRLRAGEIDVAWLPPVVFVLLARDGSVVPLVSNHRGGHAAFNAVMIVRENSRIHTLDGLRGARVAWVDPFSASGYVMPRIQLAALGVDPRVAFSDEHFYGSHDAVVRAVVTGQADVAGTFARVDGAGNVTRGAWSELPDARGFVKVLATFGSIPADVIAARATASPDVCDRVGAALVASSNDAKCAPLLRRLFGVEEFRRGDFQSYASLGRALEKAGASSLIDALSRVTL